MKPLCWRSKSQSFAGAVIQSVFNHLNFLVRNTCYPALLGHVLPQQAIEVLVGASLPTGKGPGKVARAAQRFINPGVPAKFFAVVKVRVLTLAFNGLSASMMAAPTRSAVLFETFAMTAYPLLRSTTVTMACLWLAPKTVSHSQ